MVMGLMVCMMAQDVRVHHVCMSMPGMRSSCTPHEPLCRGLHMIRACMRTHHPHNVCTDAPNIRDACMLYESICTLYASTCLINDR
jgi:hypothetical protein